VVTLIFAFLQPREDLGDNQGMYVLRQGCTPDTEDSKERMKQVQKTTEQCAADLRAARDQLEGLHAKITGLTE